MKAVFDGGGVVGKQFFGYGCFTGPGYGTSHDSGVPHEGTVGQWRIELWSGIQILPLVVSLMVVIWFIANVATVVGAVLPGSRQNEIVDRQLA